MDSLYLMRLHQMNKALQIQPLPQVRTCLASDLDPWPKLMNSSCRWRANKNQYGEFSALRLLLVNAFMLGFDSVPRTPEQGVADMQGLKGVEVKVLGNDEIATGPAGTAENADDIIMIANYLYRTWEKCQFDHPIPFAANDGARQLAA